MIPPFLLQRIINSLLRSFPTFGFEMMSQKGAMSPKGGNAAFTALHALDFLGAKEVE